MILNTLKNSHTYLIIILMIFAMFFFGIVFFTISYKNIENVFPFYSTIIVILSYIITILFCIGLNNLVHEKDVIRRPNFVIAFVFLLMTTPFIFIHKIMIFMFILLFFFKNLLHLYKQKKPFSIVFNSGIMLSILSFYIPNILFLFPLILISTLIFQNISWRIFIITILSLSIPYLFIWTFQSILNKELLIPDVTFHFIPMNLNFSQLLLHQQIWFTIISLISILSITELLRWMYKKSIRSRESFNIIIFFLLLSILIFFFTLNQENIFIVFIPTSIIISNYFIYHNKERWTEFLFLLFLLSSVFYRISMINM